MNIFLALAIAATICLLVAAFLVGMVAGAERINRLQRAESHTEKETTK